MDDTRHDGSPPPGDDHPALDEDTRITAALAEPTPPLGFARGAATVTRPQPAWNSPTLTEVAAAGAYTRAPRRRRWPWLVGLVAVLVLGGGAFVVLASRAGGQPPAEAAVVDYFRALEDGDTGAAMALVDGASAYPTKENPLLNPAALGRPADRPQGVRISGTATAATGGEAVSVTYTVGGAPVLQTIDVVHTGTTYRLRAPFVTVAVAAIGSRTVTVNAVPLPAGTRTATAFPGAYAATEAGDLLLAATTARAVYTSSSGAVAATITLPAPTVTPGATAAVQQAVNAALDACAASKLAAPPHCPFRYSADPGASVKWKITAYPKVQLFLTDGSVAFDNTGHAGTVHYDAATSYLFGLIPHTDSADAGFNVSGTATASDSGVTVTFK